VSQPVACPFCGAMIVWARTPRADLVPVDAEPAPGGSLKLAEQWDGAMLATKPTAGRAFGLALRRPHTETCAKPKLIRGYHPA
jgi:hypothetical protein